VFQAGPKGGRDLLPNGRKREKTKKVKNPKPNDQALISPRSGSWIKTKGVLECWSIGILEKAIPGI
jgi:hypothetical protein